LLVANGVPMKNIQEWLGHSNFSTTADIYFWGFKWVL
jgi:site-specific recombinase XerD